MTGGADRPFLTGHDISTLDFWGKPLTERDETFAWLRKHAPVSWHPRLEGVGPGARSMATKKGFWAVTRVEDINFVSQHHEVFSSAAAPSEDGGVPGDSMFIGMDPPAHTRYRNVISSAFTPKGVARIQAKLDERSEQIIDAVVGAGQVDFVERVSTKLPMLTIADLVGVPDSQLGAFTQAGNDLMAATVADSERRDGRKAAEISAHAIQTLSEIGVDLVQHRRQHPSDDIASAMANEMIDGRPLNEVEITGYLIVLAAAGNDTTRHTTSWTMLNLCRNPDQRDWLVEDYEGRIGQSVEEFIRMATPIGNFPRTATQDTEIAGQAISRGDKVLLFYFSGNRDESVFPDPHRFDLTRPRSGHVAFGGRGVHFCLGNVLAKAQLRTLFAQIVTKLPNIEVTGEPELINSDFVNGISRLPVNTN